MEKPGVNYCDICNVYVDEALSHCPLCAKKLTDTPAPNQLYPDVVQNDFIDKRSFTNDLFLFYTFLFIGGSILLNLIFWEGTPWFIVVAAAVLYAWIFVRVCIVSDVFPGAKAFAQMAGVMGLMLSIDYVSGWYGWSYEVILPFILTLGIVYIDFFSWIHKSLLRDNLVYAIIFVGLCFLPLIFYLTGITHVLVPTLLSTIAGALTILGILRFTIRHLSTELKKRFHI